MIFLVAITAFLIVLFGMPTLIKVAREKGLMDLPEDPRKIHTRAVPTIGGVMIFAALLINVFFWLAIGPAPATEVFQAGSAMAACTVMIFFMGLKDDIIGLSASKKLLVHLVVGLMLITIGGYKIQTFGGLFGIEELPEALSLFFSLFVYIVVVNALNLIDGVDGLAGGYSVIAMSAFAFWFMNTGQTSDAILALTLAGAMLGFLVFNFAPARIFLGDSGSLLIGLVAYALSTHVINTPQEWVPDAWTGISKPVIAMSILAYPLVDTLRAFCMRAARGISPFSPDRNHLHHRLMMRTRNHTKTSLFVYIFSLSILCIAWARPYLFPQLEEEGMFFGLFALSFLWFLPVLSSTKGQHKLAQRRDQLLCEAVDKHKEQEASESAVA
ncbi:MAG: undecaprenyl/decaprenyl-phosphate alpha-N-acetylglucosaminyl 1-phosphate transferase [Crocinitomicaceae bacterium TMED209]|nr:MAG: undecaprenyl/decaprenyl-phosphate alpha-N-acetylglucosaminyl 1-phosphate transferase [Crocinitomicaceae bacterium TMED209]|tara:strand:- start:1747 stop:2898 length:1152 start_codon:yes stop_codon:yes gene_type:complete